MAVDERRTDDLVYEMHNEVLWGEHPYGYSILGTPETVGALELEDVSALHTRAYRPEQIVVAAAGNVTHERLLEVMTAAGWMDLARGTEPAFAAVSTPMVLPPSEKTVERDIQQMHLVLGNQTVPYGDPRRHPLMLVNALFGGGMSSRLFQKVREDLGLAYSVHSFQSFHASAGMSGIYLGCAPEKVAEAMSVVRGELSLLQVAGLSAEELAMGKQQLKGQITLSMESVSSRMYRAAAIELYDEPYRPLDAVLARVDAITTGEVQAVCRDFFGADQQTIVRLGPTS